jgi:GntR family transcriptional regulator / MocR family aminotransferase
VADWHTPLPTQAALAGFIDQGYLARHIRRMRRVYQERHQLVVGILADRFSDRLKLVPSSTGLHVTATVPVPGATPAELEALLEQALAAGVALLPLSTWDAGPPSQPGLVLAYGAIPTARIAEGLRRLRRCCGASTPERPGRGTRLSPAGGARSRRGRAPAGRRRPRRAGGPRPPAGPGRRRPAPAGG